MRLLGIALSPNASGDGDDECIRQLQTVECVDVGGVYIWDLCSGEDGAGMTAVSRAELR